MRKRLFWLLAIPVAFAGLVAAGCSDEQACDNCQDVVTNIPWQAPASAEYDLIENDEDIGDAVLTIEHNGSQFVLQQSFKDDKGNSDEARVVTNADTLKPFESRRVVIDEKQRQVVEANYEPVDAEECDSEEIVIISRTVFSPPDAQEPDSERQSPLCVPKFSYENDSSLFLWRTIDFEEGNSVTYRAVLANRRDTQIVTLTVAGQEQVDVPAGTFDTWRVEITANRRTQVAWFATSDDHQLIRYNNNSLLFVLKEQ